MGTVEGKNWAEMLRSKYTGCRRQVPDAPDLFT